MTTRRVAPRAAAVLVLAAIARAAARASARAWPRRTSSSPARARGRRPWSSGRGWAGRPPTSPRCRGARRHHAGVQLFAERGWARARRGRPSCADPSAGMAADQLRATLEDERRSRALRRAGVVVRRARRAGLRGAAPRRARGSGARGCGDARAVRLTGVGATSHGPRADGTSTPRRPRRRSAGSTSAICR